MKKIFAKNIAVFSTKLLTGEAPLAVQAVLCLAVVLAYMGIWPNEFLFNDGILITRDMFLRHWSDLPDLLTHLSNAGYGLPGGFYRPVEMFIYFLLYQAFGPSTVAFHALNLGLHALNACLLYHFGLRAGFRKAAVFATALVWAVHPLHTSNVAYMSSTSELLWGTFCLLGLIILLPDFTPQKIWKAMIFFLLALGCKESAVAFPALAAATFFFVSKDRLRLSSCLKTWPLWLLSAVYITAWLTFMHKTNYRVEDVGDPLYLHSVVNRFLTFLAALPVYARLIVWPAGLHIEWLYPTFTTLLAWQPMVGALMAGLSALAVFLPRKSQRGIALSFGLLWFAVALSPYSGIVTPVDAVIAEGWMYVPTMGLFLGVAEIVAGFFEKKKGMVQSIVAALVLSLALSLGTATFFQGEIWRTPETLYLNNVRNQDWSRAESCYILGLFYLGRGDFDAAIEQFREEIYKPDGPDPRLESAHMWLAMAWLHVEVKGNQVTIEALNRALPYSRHTPEAIRELGKALQENPDFYQAHGMLAVIYRYQDNKQMADFHERKAAETVQKLKGQNG